MPGASPLKGLRKKEARYRASPAKGLLIPSNGGKGRRKLYVLPNIITMSFFLNQIYIGDDRGGITSKMQLGDLANKVRGENG